MTPEALEDFRANAPERKGGPLWSLLDWSFWSAGMADVFREPLANVMLAAVPDDVRAHAEAIMADFIERRKIDKTGVTIYQEQRAEVERLRGELATLADEGADRMAERLLEDTRMRALQIREGKAELEIEPARELAAIWVGVARTMLGDAENYSETPVEFEVGLAGERERYALIVQRVGQLTPHEARRQAEGERDEVAARLDAQAVEHRDDAAGWRASYDRLSARATRLWWAWQNARRGRARMRAERDEARAEVAATAARWTEHADKQSTKLRKAEADLAAARAAVERLRRELREAGR
jgi:hypothetical protein